MERNIEYTRTDDSDFYRFYHDKKVYYLEVWLEDIDELEPDVEACLTCFDKYNKSYSYANTKEYILNKIKELMKTDERLPLWLVQALGKDFDLKNDLEPNKEWEMIPGQTNEVTLKELEAALDKSVPPGLRKTYDKIKAAKNPLTPDECYPITKDPLYKALLENNNTIDLKLPSTPSWPYHIRADKLSTNPNNGLDLALYDIMEERATKAEKDLAIVVEKLKNMTDAYWAVFKEKENCMEELLKINAIINSK